MDTMLNAGALKDVRVADFGWVLAGPYATMLLSYMGAEVIKIESKKRIDEQRQVHRAGLSENYEASSNFFEINLNKRSVSLDISTPKGSELARKLVSISDVVVENMRPGVMDKLGLGYKDLVKVKPDIIMISMSGWGQTGPLREYTAYAPCFASYSGIAHLTGYADGEPNNGTSSNDARSGTAAAFAIMMALNIRQRTGQGQFIDMSSSEALNTLIGDQMMDFAMNQRSPWRAGNRDSIMAPHNCYRCRGDDKWISIAVATDEEWQALCQAMGSPEWTRAEVLSEAYGRWQNREWLDRQIQEWTSNYSHLELMDLLQGEGVAAMPSFNAEELFSNPHLLDRESFIEVQHAVLGKRPAISPPWKMSETPPRIVSPAPLLGENNEYVLGSLLGIPMDELAQLIEDRIVY
jgi:crotonobetainyl-CoA:carnitine CoA-transferase CaiB-like acyl-CoA transferase